MPEDWTATAAEAAQAIADNGLTVTIKRQGPGPQTPWETALQMETTATAKAVDLGIRRLRQGLEVVQRRVLLMAAGDTAPRIGDTVTVRDMAHAVTAVMPTAPGGVDVMVKVELQA